MQSLSVSTFKQFRDFLSRKFGIEYDFNHLEQMENRLRERIAQVANGSYENYLERVRKNGDETRFFLSLISTNKTNFFRHPSQFRALAEVILPALSKTLPTGAPVQVLSAGCSRGAELYSILITLDDAGFLRDHPVQGLGLDVDSEELEIARSGLYFEENMLDIPRRLLDKYFTPKGDRHQLAEKFTKLAEFRFFNLMDPLTVGPFDLIFCRNCLIYFREDNKNRITEDLFRALKIGGYFLLSPNEYIRDNFSGALKEIEVGGERAYTKVNPQKTRELEYHFASNLDVMKVQQELEKKKISYKLEKIPPGGDAGRKAGSFFVIQPVTEKQFESVLKITGLRPQKKKERFS